MPGHAAPSAPSFRSPRADALGLILLALAMRLAMLPLATQDTNDHSLRLWIAQRWSEDPFLLLHGHWPPLHFFLLGPVIRLTGDMFLAPILLQMQMRPRHPSNARNMINNILTAETAGED